MTMGTASFLRPAPTVVSAPPPGSSPQQRSTPGVVSELKVGVSDAMQGRISLIMLEAFAISLIAFYLWTRRAQGGG